MPYTIHTAKAKIRDALGNFRSVDVFSNEIEDTQQAAIQAVNDAKTAAINVIDDRANAKISPDVTNDEVEAMLAPIFDTATAYAAGTYVRNADGSTNKLYRLTADHAANTTWTNTSKVEVKIGSQVTDLKNAVAINVGGITRLINVPSAGGSVWFDAYLVAGAEYVFTNNTTVACSLRAQKSDGTLTTLKSEVSANSSYTFTAGDNFVKIGGWFNTSGSVTLSGNIGLVNIQATATALQNALEDTNKEVAAIEVNSITYDVLKNAVGYNRKNYLSDVSTTSGKYVLYTTGVLDDNADYSVTDYFPIYPGAVYELYYYSPGSQIAYYDYDKTYIGGSLANARNFTVPDNQAIKFARWCGETSRRENWQLYLANIVTDGIKTIIPSEGLLAGIKDAYSKGDKTIIVQPGTYNVITEYTNYYGSTYFSAYTDNYNGEINGAFDRGLWLDSVNITFQPGAIVEAKYTGNNEYVRTYFSAFAVGANVTIDGLVLDAENLRYGIHPDFHPNSNPDTFIVKNCDLHHYKTNASDQYNANQAIGAGLGVHSAWTFENCIFRSDTSYPVFRIHNNVSSSAKSSIIIKNCYIVGNGFIRLNSYSTSTEQTMALVTGCSWINPAVVGKETQSSTDNITMYSWGNETRT